MAQYIDKDAVIAEMEREKVYAQTMGDNAINSSMQQFYDGMKEGCNSLLNILDTLELKEVDLIEERMKECPHKQVGCTMYDGHILECRGACSWVVDYMNLKELKQMKGG